MEASVSASSNSARQCRRRRLRTHPDTVMPCSLNSVHPVLHRHRLPIGHVAGVTPRPDNRWMTQIARNLTDVEEGFLRGTRYLILYRDTKYSDEFRAVLVRDGIDLIRLLPRSPNLNAFAERFVRSIKSECLNRMISFYRPRCNMRLRSS